jgi:hypothetical protein
VTANLPPAACRALEDLAHAPQRPSWDCAGCARPWPCDPAREELADSITATYLTRVMSDFSTVAADDLTTTGITELHDRFVSWTTSTSQGT